MSVVELVPTHINGRWWLNLPKHRADRPEWLWWEATRLAAMRTVIDESSVVYDIGGEEGDFPALWASWGARVAIAEPNPKVWPNIRAIFEGNASEYVISGRYGLLADALIDTFVGFVGDVDREPEGGWPAYDTSNMRWPVCASGDVIGDHGFCQLGERPDLPTITLDRWVEHNVAVRCGSPPTVVTMDVEGSELHVLRGAEYVLREYRPHVFVSIHPEFMAHHYGEFGGVESVRELMESYGYPRDQHRFLCIDHEHHWWFRP